jgi:hypothetical protein
MLNRSVRLGLASLLLFASVAQAQYPLLDLVAQKVIRKYQQASCEQLWEKRSAPKSQREKDMIQVLRSDPQMASAFINRVAAPIANKLFQCGMIP